MTAVDNSTFSAAEFNTYIRDNLLETFPAKATAAGQYFVSTGHIGGAARTPVASTVTGSNTTTSTAYATLTGNTSVTVTTGIQAIVFFAAKISNNTANAATRLSFKITGTTNTPAFDKHSIVLDGVPANEPQRMGSFHRVAFLKTGSHTFTLQGRVSAGTTGSFSNRHLAVFPL
jgi:hypothetical protein